MIFCAIVLTRTKICVKIRLTYTGYVNTYKITGGKTMKKLSALLLAALLIMSVICVIPVSAAEEFTYAHIVASGNDPYASFNFSPDGNHTTIDPDTVKWASIKYRTITETDNTGVQLIGQFYISPAVEPFVPIKYNHTKQWETLVVDLTSVSQKTSLESAWNSTKYTAVDSIRFDPLESNRDAEAQDGENDEARVQDGDSIDIAFIAFFDNEEDAKAYDGSQDTPYCIILPEDMEWFTGDNAIGSVEIVEGKKPRPETTPAPATDPVTTEADTTEPDTSAAPATDPADSSAPATDAPGTADVTTGESSVEKTESGKFPVWAIIIIAVAVVVLIAAILASVLGKKKKK